MLAKGKTNSRVLWAAVLITAYALGVLAAHAQVSDQPDLEVGTPTVSSAIPLPGGSFTLSATVSNAGAGGSAATTLRYYRSTDATITTSDTAVGTDAVEALSASGTSAESIELTASSTEGTYYYGACVDAVTDESDTTDNCSSSVRVYVFERADLEVVSFYVTPRSVSPYDNFIIGATVRNRGKGDARVAATLRYYRSTDKTITTSDTEVGTDKVYSLAASASSDQAHTLRAFAKGTYYYGACIDNTNQESNTSNNCSAADTLLVGAPPDLEVGTPTVSDASPATGGTFTLSATVRNTGTGRSKATTLRWYRSTDATITTADTSVGTDEVGRLHPSRSSSESISLTAPSTVGTYYYGACVDAVTDETDTTDNCSSSVQVDVSEPAPDLEVGTPSVSDASPATGGTFTLSATVRNTGAGGSAATTLRWYRSTDATITTSDTAIGTDEVGGLAASGTSSESISLTAPSTAGTYYYGACVDAVTDESDNTDNCSSSVRVDVSEPAPDLAVGTPSVSDASPGTGGSFTLSATVRNTGARASAATTLRWYRSTDATITASDTAVGTDAVGGLAASGTSSKSISLTAPSAAGTYYYGACVDAVTDESDTTDNCSSSVRVDASERAPDLEVGTPSVSAARPVAGASFSLSATVRNTGTGGSASTTLRWYRSTDATITASDTAVGTDDVGALSASGTSAESIVLTAPSTVGTYYYGACVDTVTDESDTTDNCSATVRVYVVLSPGGAQPDLEIVSFYVVPRSVSPYDNFIVGATVRNRGDGDARVAATLRYYYSADATISTADTEVGTDTIFSLAASASSEQAHTLRARAAGTFYYGACIDVTINESDSSNNCSDAVTLVVGAPPDLEVGTPSVSDASPATGATFTLSATVRNTGAGWSEATTLRYYRSTDATITSSDTTVGTDEVGRISPSRTSSELISLIAPSTAGTYYYGACVDAVTDETDTADNCSPAAKVEVGTEPPDLEVGTPSVSDAGPATGGTFTLSATVRNTGAGGSAATTLRWYRSTDATITASDTSVGTDAVGALSESGTSNESISLTAPSTAGTYYYGACVDAVTDESDTTDNCSPSVKVQVGTEPPDLEVGMPSVSDAGPVTGGTFTLSATVRNTGAGGSAATTLRWYRSTDATITSSDTAIGTDAVGALSASRTSAEWISLTAPGTAGMHYYGACVDTLTDETDTADNCSSAVRVDVSEPAPDLEVGAPSVSDAGPATGGSFTLSATIRNTGSGKSAATTLRWYRSTDATITSSDTSVGTDAVGTLSASGTSTESIVLTASSTAGTYHYGACVDAVTDESDTADNCSSSVKVVVGAPPPDLEVGTPTVSDASPARVGSFTLSATVRNTGAGGSASTTLRYYLSTDATITSSDTAVGTDPVDALAASGTSAESISLTAPGTAGTYYYGACVDAVADESDATDNCSSSVKVDVEAPIRFNLVVGTPSVSDNRPTAGSRFSLSATVRNNGNSLSETTTLHFYRSTDAIISASDTSVGMEAVGRVAVSGSNTKSITLTAPSTVGQHYYGACVDAPAGESDSSDNCSAAVAVYVVSSSGNPQPDLEVVFPYVTPRSVNPFDTFILGATVRNRGDGDARVAATLRYYYSPDATISTADTEIGTDTIFSLAASASSDEAIVLRARAAGTFYYGACIDVTVQESDSSNNCSAAVELTVEGDAPVDYPDLTVQSPSVSLRRPNAGGIFTVSATVGNMGGEDAVATRLRIFRSEDQVISGNDLEVGAATVASLTAYTGSARISVGVTAPTDAGTYYYGACVDAVTDESDTTNNCSSSVRVDVSEPAPDLEVGTPSASDAGPAPGGSFTLSATVRNTGARGSATTTLRWYRSTDATISASDTAIGTDEIGGLAASGSSDEAISLTAPSTAGTYYYGACVDTVTGESEATDNCSSSVRVDVSEPAPDLEVGTPSVSDAGPAPGGTLTLSATVRNTGTGRSAATTLRWYRSTDAAITTSDTAMGTDAVRGLAASRSSSKSISLIAPSTVGTYYYGLCVDAVTGESDTTDNCSPSVKVEIGAGPPDLAVGMLSVSDASLVTGATFTLSATVRNTGTGGAVATTLRWYRSTDATITTADTAIGTDAIGGLAASGTSRESISLTVPSTAGTYYYGACVDAVTDESDTTDNCSSSLRVDVTEPTPDLEVTTPSVSDAGPPPDGSFTLSATVRNTGAEGSAATTLHWYRSTDATITTADIAEGTDPVGTLAASGTSDESISLTAPSTVGTYYYGACVDTVADESDTADNCSSSVKVGVGAPPPDLEVGRPSVSDAAPFWGGSFTLSATVRNTGARGSAATTLRWYRSTDATITTSDTSVGTDEVVVLAASGTSSESISIQLGSPQAPPGTYFYGACVDAVGDEVDTTDNCSTAAKVDVRPPNPVFGTPTVSDASPLPGGSFTISVPVSNTGTSTYAVLGYVASPDPSIQPWEEPEDKFVGEGLISETGTASIVLTAPLTPGTYYYGACLNPSNNLRPRSTYPGSDLCSSSVQVVVGTQPPDLEVGTPTVSDAGPAPGGTFTLSATVSNRGTESSAATTLRYYRSTDATITTADTPVGTDAIGALSASGISSESISVTAPSAAGTYFYGACVDAVTNESDRTDNCSPSVKVVVGAPPPDLEVGTPTVSDASPQTGGSFTLSATVSNTGTGGSAATTLRWYRSTDATITTSDTAVGTDAVVALAASGISAESIPLRAPSTAGTYYYGACVDALTDESDTTDNCSTSVKVTAATAQPNLRVGTPSVTDAGPDTGGEFQLSVVVRNWAAVGSAATTLRYYRSTDATITTSDASVGTDAVGALDALGTGSESILLTAPQTAGAYYYGACVDAVVDESDTTDNCSPSVKVEVGAKPPDLVVSMSIAYGTSGTFRILARVHNQGAGGSAATTLRYYRSTDAAISTSDTSVGTDAIGGLAASGSRAAGTGVSLPSTAYSYYYSACVDPVAGESDTTNNCSNAVRVDGEDENAAARLLRASVDGDALTLTFNEPLDGDSVPPASSFAVTVAGSARTVDSVAVAGSAVTLTLSSAVTVGEAVTVGYTVPTGEDATPVEDADGGPAAAFAEIRVTNETGPLPVVSIAPSTTPVTEGTAAEFTLSRTGATDAALTVSVSIEQSGSVLGAALPSSATFRAGSAKASLSVPTVNDETEEADSRVTVSIVAGGSYAVDGEPAGVDVLDDDATPAAGSPAAALWSTTMIWTDLGAGRFGGYTADFRNPEWSEGGKRFRIWWIAYDPGTRVLEVAHDGSGGTISAADRLALHIGGLRIGSGEALTAFAQGSIGTVRDVALHWEAGDRVTVRLTRTTRDDAPTDPGFSVADAQVNEAGGALLRFMVTLDAAATEAVSVRYRTSDGTARAGADYVAAHGALRFASGETEKMVEVRVLADRHDEGRETMTLSLSDASGARLVDAHATGTIVNTDPIPTAWMARFGRTVGTQVMEAVSSRLDGGASPHFNLGGVSLAGGHSPLAAQSLSPQGWIAEPFAQGYDAQRPGEHPDTGRNLLLGSSFHLVSQAEGRRGPALSTWGRVAADGFQAEADGISLNGEVVTGFLGFDAEWERLLAGLLVAHSAGDGAYRPTDDSDRATLKSTLTGVYPYARLRLTTRLSVWGLAGVGSGDLTLVRRDETIDTGLGLHLGAVGVSGTLLENGAVDLALRSDALWVRTESDAATGLASAAAQVSRLRLLLEGGRTFALAAGSALRPTLRVGLRHDGGDAETGTGLEVGAGLHYVAGMLTLEAQVRTLLAHEAVGYEDWGVSGAIRLSPHASGLGPTLAVMPAWGVASDGVAQLWSSTDASFPVQDKGSPDAGRLDAELGWGLRALSGQGILTPYARVGLVEGYGRSWHLGTRLALVESLSLSVEGSRREHAGTDAAHDIALHATMPW